MVPILVMIVGIVWIIGCVDFFGLPGLVVGLLSWGVLIAALGHIRNRLDPMQAYDIEHGITRPPKPE